MVTPVTPASPYGTGVPLSGPQLGGGGQTPTTTVGKGDTLFTVRDSKAEGWVGQLNNNGAGKTLRTKATEISDAAKNKDANRLVGLHLYRAIIAEGPYKDQVLYYLKDQGTDTTYPLVGRDNGNTARPWKPKTLSEAVARAESLIEKGRVGKGLDFYSQAELNGSPLIASSTLRSKGGQSVPVIANSERPVGWAGDAEVGRQGAVRSGINGQNPAQRVYYLEGQANAKDPKPRWLLDVPKAAPAKPEAQPAARETRQQRDEAALELARKHIKHGHVSPERLYPYEEQADNVLNGWGGSGLFALGLVTGKLPGRASTPGKEVSGLFFPSDNNGRRRSGLCTTAVLETHALHGIPNPPATGGDPINPRGAAVQYVKEHGWKPVNLPGSKPLTLNSPYGEVTVQSLTRQQYLQAVADGKIQTGDLVFQTQHGSWNQVGVRSSGYDTAIAINGGRNHHNGLVGRSGEPLLADTLVYGDATQSVFVLRNDVRQRQFEAQLIRQGGAGGLQAGAVAGRGGGLESINHPFKPLLALIIRGESDPRAPTPWDSINRRRAGDTLGGRSGLSQMTIGQIQHLQARGELYAVGAFQLIPKTLSGVARAVGLGPNAPFSPSNQVKLALGLISGRPALHSYLTGKVPDTTANLRLALADLQREWASVQGLNGRGHYADAGSIKAREALAALKQARNAHMASQSG